MHYTDYTDGRTAFVVSLLTVSLLSSYVLWGMSGDESQLLGSLENEDASNSEPGAESPPPPALFCSQSFFSKKRQRSSSDSIDRHQEQPGRSKTSTEGAGYAKRSRHTPRDLPLSVSISTSTHVQRGLQGLSRYVCVCVCLSVCLYVSQNLTSQMSN